MAFPETLPTARTGRSITRKGAPRGASYKVTFVTPEAATDVQVAPDEYLLSAAHRMGLELPFSCLQGWCMVAVLLFMNGIVPEDAVMNAQTLPMVMMPARDRFVEDDRRAGGGVEIR